MRALWYRLVGWAGTNRVTRWLHPILYRRTGGAGPLGRSLGNLTVLLTTTGRRSGAERTTALWVYPDGDALVAVGSYAGNRHTPAWVYNLREHPVASVLVRRDQRTVRAHEATGDEYARLWELVCSAYPGYRSYLEWAHRSIPLVVLDPA